MTSCGCATSPCGVKWRKTQNPRDENDEKPNHQHTHNQAQEKDTRRAPYGNTERETTPTNKTRHVQKEKKVDRTSASLAVLDRDKAESKQRARNKALGTQLSLSPSLSSIGPSLSCGSLPFSTLCCFLLVVPTSKATTHTLPVEPRAVRAQWNLVKGVVVVVAKTRRESCRLFSFVPYCWLDHVVWRCSFSTYASTVRRKTKSEAAAIDNKTRNTQTHTHTTATDKGGHFTFSLLFSKVGLRREIQLRRRE